MDRDSVGWKGYWVAAPTPFAVTGALDESALRSVLRLYHDQGVHGVLVNGTTGEWFSQTEAERRRVAEIAVEELGGKIPVVIGCTTFTPSQTIALGLHAREIGADGMLSTPPPYAAPTPREVIAFFSAISDSVDLPIMVYNWARGVAVEITWETAIELAKIPRIVAIKDSTVNRVQALTTLEKVCDRVRIFGGFIDRLGLSVLRDLGGDGNIDGGGLGAQFAVAFYEAFWRDDIIAAQHAASCYVALMTRLIRPDWSGMFGSPQAQLKACMNMLGQPGGHVRPPLLSIDDPRHLQALRQILDEAGLFAGEATLALVDG
ncbi:MAG TPA: dihydrodipicolinate synthase family protein [Ktedonobacterales bacterium]|nr:dihydrodipicolinate synthase family protein [Ktedonobacterales bacterium]